MLSIDFNKKIIEPDLYLAKPDRTIIAKLKPAYNIIHKIRLGKVSELEFCLPYQIEIKNEFQRNPHIDLLRYRYLIKLEYKDKNYEEWFILDKPVDNMEEDSDYKLIQCFSLQYELSGKKIKNYKRESAIATNLLQDAIEDTLWIVGYVHPKFDKMYRTIDISMQSSLELIFEIAETFGGLLIFNTINRTISLYQEDDIGEDKGLKFSYGKYLKSMNKELDPTDFCTIMKCFGQNNISINEVNPTGFNYIFDYSYFLYPYSETITDEINDIYTVNSQSYYMSDNLCHKILKYNKLLESKNGTEDVAESGTTTTNITMTDHGLVNGDWIINKTRYNEYRKVTVVDANNVTVDVITDQNNSDIILKYKDGTFRKLLFQKEEKQTELTTLNNELTTLNNELIIILDNLAVAEENGEDTSTLITQRDNKISEINNKETEINNKEIEINNIDTNISNIRYELALENNFILDEREESKSYNKEEVYENSNIINAQDLYDVSLEEFQKKISPQIIININTVNFLQCIESQFDWDKLNLGDIVTVNNEILNVNNSAKITEIDFLYENEDTNLVISDIKEILSIKDRGLKKLYESIYTANKLKDKQVNWDLNLINFNSRNDRITTTPADPIIPNDGTAIDHVINDDGSCDISFEWNYNGSGDAYNIDGFIVYIRSSTSNNSYIFGSKVAKEDISTISAEKRGFLIRGVPVNQYYTFGVQAYRVVDSDINEGGVLKSNIVKSTYTNENPYLPSVNVAFNGDVTGTVAGVAADSISKTPATFIVADGSTSNNTKRADYVVPAGSTSAEDTINAAINSLPISGGKILLLEGTYIIDGSIILTSNLELELLSGVTIKLKNNFDSSIDMIQGIGVSNIKIIGGVIDGNKANQASGSVDGIWLGGSSSDCIVENVTIKDCLEDGIQFRESETITVNKCNVNNCRWGIALYYVVSNNYITNNKVTNSEYGILAMFGASNNTIIGNICNNNTFSGIYLSWTVDNSVISNNVCNDNGKEGIFVDTSKNNIISNNTCIGNSQTADNTYDNILVVDNSDYNNIQSNICRKGSLTNKPRYGIRIDSSNCDGNIVTNNDLHDSGVTGSFSDSGTGTITVAGNRL